MKRQLLFFLMLAISIISRAGDRLSALPYPILGGELSNSATTSVEDIDEVMPRMKALGLNTVAYGRTACRAMRQDGSSKTPNDFPEPRPLRESRWR